MKILVRSKHRWKLVQTLQASRNNRITRRVLFWNRYSLLGVLSVERGSSTIAKLILAIGCQLFKMLSYIPIRLNNANTNHVQSHSEADWVRNLKWNICNNRTPPLFYYLSIPIAFVPGYKHRTVYNKVLFAFLMGIFTSVCLIKLNFRSNWWNFCTRIELSLLITLIYYWLIHQSFHCFLIRNSQPILVRRLFSK